MLTKYETLEEEPAKKPYIYKYPILGTKFGWILIMGGVNVFVSLKNDSKGT